MRWKTISQGRLWAQDFVLWKQTPAVNLEMSVLCLGKNVWLSLKEAPSSHLQQPRGPADASRLLSVSEAKVGSVDIEDTSLTDDDDDGC